MRTIKIAAALLVGGLGLGTAAALPSATAAPATSSADQVRGALPTAPVAGRAWIQGIVTDQAGRPRDNVVVEAFAPGSATPVASWITYASPRGGAAHGWYRLYVRTGRATSFTLRYSSPRGAKDPFRTRTYGAAVTARSGKIVKLDPVELQLVRRAATRTDLSVTPDTRKAGKAGRLSVEVTSPDVAPVEGSLKVTVDGRSLATVRLTARSDGEAVVKLPRLRVGSHRIKVAFTGAANVKDSADDLKVVVKKPRRHRG